MKEFALIFRHSSIDTFHPSPEQMHERMNWLASIVAQNKLVDRGNTLSPFEGNAKTVIRQDLITDGPFTEIKEFITGYLVIRAESIEEAIDVALANPLIKSGGSIEVREIIKRY